MLFLILILLLLIFYKSKINLRGFFSDYLQKDKTLAIKGIFVIFVFYRHCATYIDLTKTIDMPMVFLDRVLNQSIISLFFSLLIVMLTMKFSINNKLLVLLGKNVFWMYILQRIPMIAFTQFGINKCPYTFFILCFIITIGLSYIYTNIVDKKINRI